MIIITLLVVFSIICLITYSTKNHEQFCSSCTGPIVHRYKYGDPFYTYMHDQRRKYERYYRNPWMNLTEKQRNDDRENLKYKMDNWLAVMKYNKYGDHPNTEYPSGIDNNRRRNIINKYLSNREPDRPWEKI